MLVVGVIVLVLALSIVVGSVGIGAVGRSCRLSVSIMSMMVLLVSVVSIVLIMSVYVNGVDGVSASIYPSPALPLVTGRERRESLTLTLSPFACEHGSVQLAA